MNIPKYARYEYCAQKACEFLEEYNITSYPIDVEKLIQDKGWGLTPYSLIMSELNYDRQTVIRCLRSEDGYTQLDSDNYSIAYNDDPKLGDRIRFTLMHEVGHIYLNHLEDFDITLLYRGSLSKEENHVLENEANAFARNVLVPISMLQHLKDKSVSNIATSFGITPAAAKTRLDLFYTDIDKNRHSNLLNRLLQVFHNFYYKKYCPNCGYHTVIKLINYCPICGHKSMQWGDGKMKYPLLDTHENGKLRECPNCHNEETDIEGDYCHICGRYMVNKCSSYDCANTNTLPSNARFCPICGNNSTFSNAGFLKPWNHDDQYLGGFSNIPFEIDEELPFN